MENSEQSVRKGRTITDGAANLISRVEELAYELTIGEVMSRNVKTIAPGTKMGDVMETFRQARISGAPVVSNGDLIGIVSLEDLIRALRESNIQAPVGEYMTRQVMTVKAATVKAVRLIEQAKKEVRIFGRKAGPLVFLADFLKARIPT